MPLAYELTEYQVQQTYPLKGCHNCRFNNWRLCTKVSPRDAASFYAANDCHDWQREMKS